MKDARDNCTADLPGMGDAPAVLPPPEWCRMVEVLARQERADRARFDTARDPEAYARANQAARTLRAIARSCGA